MLAAVTAWQQNGGLPARAKSLTIDGLDVLRAPTSTGNTYGVPIGSIELVEASPGQVSSLSFIVEDPAGEVTIADGAYVRLDDLTRDLPLFAGFVASARSSSFGVGRTITVTCTGIEAVLDWWQVPALTFTAPFDVTAAIQSVVAQAYRTGSVQINAAATLVAWAPSTLALPVALNGLSLVTLAITGGSLRQALAALAAVWLPDVAVTYAAASVTVDFRHGLRMAGVFSAPPWYWDVGDYADMNVSGAPNDPSETQYELDATSAVRAVYVQGGNAAGSGLVSGSPAPGQVTVVSDANSLTESYRNTLAAAALAAPTTGGTVSVDDGLNAGAVGAERRAGQRMLLGDPNLVAATFFPTSQITKRFLPSGVEHWTLSFGTQATGSQYLRRLTRTQATT